MYNCMQTNFKTWIKTKVKNSKTQRRIYQGNPKSQVGSVFQDKSDPKCPSFHSL